METVVRDGRVHGAAYVFRIPFFSPVRLADGTGSWVERRGGGLGLYMVRVYSEVGSVWI